MVEPTVDDIEDTPADDGTSIAKLRWLDVAIGVALVTFTIATRLPRLSRPEAFVFDEVYYAPDAADILRRGVERGGVVHPPVGKWLIALGIRADGFTSLGWRLSALVCGALVVLLVYVAARQVVTSRWLASMAGVLAALDGVLYTTGRVAMLDIFVALFVMIAVWCTLAALRRAGDGRAVARYRWGAAVSVGLGIGVKWTTAYVLLVVIIGFVAIHIRERREQGQGRAVATTLATLVVVPVLVYAACYIPWIVNFDKTYPASQKCGQPATCSFSIAERVRLLVKDQRRILDFHTGLLSDGNSNADFAYLWWDQTSPSVLYRKTCVDQLNRAPRSLNDQACIGASNGDVAEIVAVANPAVWFVGLLAAFVVVWTAWQRRSLAALLVLLFFFYQWFPWVIDPFKIGTAIAHHDPGALLQQRRAYSFYLAPMIAVLAIFPAVALDRRRWRWTGIPLVAVAAATFIFYLPVFQGRPMAPSEIDHRQYWEGIP